jgi:S-adenosylmethionine:tRNA ribosyltransferase-isomerase
MSGRFLLALKTSDFHYDLPSELIAQRPLPRRTGSRLLCLDGSDGSIADRCFRDLGHLLLPGDLLVLNDTRVIPARLYGRKESGGRVEVLVERVLEDNRALVHIRSSKTPRSGASLFLDGGPVVRVEGRDGALFVLAFPACSPVAEVLERCGHVPLPPYITREDSADDLQRYQTVYAARPGAVAAPTAGLHFDAAMLKRLGESGVRTTHITLHVGAGTFRPVRVLSIEDHQMHAERVEVGAELCAQVEAARGRGGRIVAVGTTVTRALETAALGGKLQPFAGDTRLFIHPGFDFRVVDALVTNFHLPESTLLMLVCAFAGYQDVMRAYRHAVAERYRFFSYGDAMFLRRQSHRGG